MADNKKLDFAAKMEKDHGIDPDQIMMLTDDEFNFMIGNNPGEGRTIDELKRLYDERHFLLDEIKELKEILIPEAEELIDSASYGEALAEFRSDLSSYRANLTLKEKRLVEVHNQIKALLASFEDMQKTPVTSEEESYEQLTIDGFNADNEEDEVSMEISALNQRQKMLSARIDYIMHVEIPMTEEERDNARDYMHKIECSQDISSLHLELSKLEKELDFVEARLEELTGLKR